MTTEYHDEASDESSFWNKDSRSNRLQVFSMKFRLREVLLPVVTAVVILSIIIALVVSNARTGSRLSQLEETLSHANETLTSSLTLSKGALKETHRMQFAVESNKDQLASVTDALTRLSVLDVLSRTVAGLRCSVERLIHNRTLIAGCCPLDWEPHASSCYYYSTVGKAWEDARDWCSGQEAHLVIMNTPEDWEYLSTRLGQGGSYHWVGLSDARTGKWEWVNQTPYTMNRRHWMPGQPDNWEGHGLGGTEDCAHHHSNQRLNDLHCSNRLRFVCQKHSA